MTYVVGIKRDGIVAIISDSRVTFEHEGVSNNYALKTGAVFQGCIFGRAGDAQASAEFIKAARGVVGSKTPSSNWLIFQEFVKSYPVSTDQHFKLLISSRASGKPKLYELDSRCGLVEVEGDTTWTSIGSGKELLDPIVEKCLNAEIPEGLTQEKLSEIARDYSYVLCLWLTTIAQSFERVQLEEVGVGGVFHFLFQTERGDHVQSEALYLMISPDYIRKSTYCWMYRVAFVDNNRGLVVEYLIPPGQDVDWPEGRRIPIVMYDNAFAEAPPQFATEDELKAWKVRLWDEINAQPFYYCLGYMASDLDKRNKFGLQFPGDSDEYWVGKDGSIGVTLQSRIAEILDM